MNHFEQFFFDIKKQFTLYADTFFTGENSFDCNIMLKKEHSLRVMDEALMLAAKLKLPDREYLLAGSTGLLHDIGRFEQFKKYRTFVDIKSENHGKLGQKILKNNFCLDCFSDTEKNILFSAVAHHNCRKLPAELSSRETAMTMLVRDADKLDIMHVVLLHYQQPNDNDAVILELDNSTALTPAVKDAVLNHVTVSISDLLTVADFKIAQLAWVYDLNYHHSVVRYCNLKYHYQLKTFLPKSDEIENIFMKICQYLDMRLTTQSGAAYLME